MIMMMTEVVFTILHNFIVQDVDSNNDNNNYNNSNTNIKYRIYVCIWAFLEHISKASQNRHKE